MYFKSPHSHKLKKIKKLIRPIEYKNTTYYQVLIKGESHQRLVKKDSIIGKRYSLKRNSNSDLKEIVIENNLPSSSEEELISISDFIIEVDYEEKGDLSKDIPEKIINVGKINKSSKELYCEIKWKKGKDGIQKKNSIVKTSEIKELYPKMLIDFYESKIVFLKDF